MALAIFALLATPLFITQGTIVRGVAHAYSTVQRIFFAENLFIDARAQDAEKQSFTLEKKIPSPQTQLNYSRSPIDKKSAFQAYEGLLVEKVALEWSEMGQKKQDTVVNFMFKPERKKQ